MVSPVWSPHTAAVEHTRALAKWRQTVRIETIAGQLSTPGRARDRAGREAQPTEDRQRDRAQGAKAACEGHGYPEGRQVARHRDWHGPAHRKRASDESARGEALSKGERPQAPGQSLQKPAGDALDPPVGGTVEF